MFHPPRVLEKWHARSDQDDQVILILLGRHETLMQQNRDFRQHVDMNARGLLADAAIGVEHVENPRVVVCKTLHWQHSLHLPSCVAVAQPDFIFYSRHKYK